MADFKNWYDLAPREELVQQIKMLHKEKNNAWGCHLNKIKTLFVPIGDYDELDFRNESLGKEISRLKKLLLKIERENAELNKKYVAALRGIRTLKEHE